MAGGFVASTGGHKIKGGKWTVFRFFLVSVAFTSAWVAVSSQLAYYRQLHGPAVLLQLNIAYFMPSIPLLIVSAFLDKPLEESLGVAKTILMRLLVGLLGYGGVCIWFPFLPTHIWYLLGAVIAFGLFGGIAFSAAYQLVARFANKNVIALGLGCSASGPLVLLLELALEMGPNPTRTQLILLYEIIALVIAAGLWATVSLLWRHWDSIESHASKQELTEPLLDQQQQAGVESPMPPSSFAAAAESAAAEEGEQFFTPATSPLRTAAHSPRTPAGEGLSPRTSGASVETPPSTGGQLQLLAASVWRQRSLPPLVAYPSLEPYQTFLQGTELINPHTMHTSWSDTGPITIRADSETAADTRGRGWQRQASSGRRLSAPPLSSGGASPADVAAEAGRSPPISSKPALKLSAAEGPATAAAAAAAAAVPPLEAEAGVGGDELSAVSVSASRQALRLMWPPLAALTLSSTISLIVFPLFTYVPTSGLLGESLPKVIFFVRIFADVLGRFLPRLRAFNPRSPYTPLLVSVIKLTGVPIFLLYLKSPPRLHSDVAIVLFVTLMWVMGGYINTMSNVLAPRMVPPQLKSAAAGLMAIAFQVAHFLGLAVATLAALLMYGHVGPHEH